jgi:acetyl-CoA carboxylase biotin carboxyl carrier protein
VTDELLPPPEDEAEAFDGVPVLGAEAIVVPPPTDGGDASLLQLIDRLTEVLERSDLTELEVEAGGTGLLLRKPLALERAIAVSESVPMAAGVGAAAPSSGGAGVAEKAAPAQRPSIKAPLTGIFYGSPSPGATPYVAIGDHVSVGQVIGLIEAMKLFNEIKSDLAGRVVRVVAENGALVKAKSPLIEVEPS